MSDNPFSLWVYLSQSPLLWLTVTLLTYVVADAVSLATHRHPLANPVLHSIWILGAFLLLTKTSYATYFGGAQFVHFLLGPATVAARQAAEMAPAAQEHTLARRCPSVANGCAASSGTAVIDT